MGRIVGACQDCRKGYEKWEGLWVPVQTSERDSKMGKIVGVYEDCRKGFGKWGGLWVLVKTAERDLENVWKMGRIVDACEDC